MGGSLGSLCFVISGPVALTSTHEKGLCLLFWAVTKGCRGIYLSLQYSLIAELNKRLHTMHLIYANAESCRTVNPMLVT